ncbi:DNA topoisomerase 2-binding protein 1-A isoform X2 [Cephus cinctus]|uniref:DNA topoisomerase 2-binding protein 1-A isoform X2 n=1 Tax=Cephus cinctus TaxID=211228 RepID=A0AAJ7FJS0_CEPCN|nr:DNA topoisomerase 2-binding protein 1-A isoform X2 [Cephus cinctus]
MDTQESQIDSDLHIYFVIPSKCKNENDCTEDMWLAFNKCIEHDLSPRWIFENKCNMIDDNKKNVFVMDEFSGEVFEKLRNFKCSRVVGPRCMLHCFMSCEPIPEGTSPVYLTAMSGLVVTASGFSVEVKDKLKEKVEYMGGIFTRQLRSSVTHLIADFVMSAKYERAVENGLAVFTEHWLDAVWNTNLQQFVKATDSMFDKYKCPVFLNLVITSTNLPRREKDELKKLIDNNGGIFMGALDGSKVKVVLAPENSALSDKLKYALQNNIPCVKSEWIYESIKKGYALPFNDFLIKSTKACSTPDKSQGNETLNFSTVSAIPGEYNQNSLVEESMATTMITTMTSMAEYTPTERSADSSASYIQVIERLNVKEAKMAGPFLDGCNIYLAGFPASHREKLNRILNVGSATRFDNISYALTHILVGDPSRASNDLKIIQTNGVGACLLKINWLEESIKLKRPAAEEAFLYEEEKTVSEKPVEPPSPLSKKSLQMLQPPRRPPIPSFNIDKPMSVTTDMEEPDLVQQYLQKSVASDKTLQHFLEPHNATLTRENEKAAASSNTINHSNSLYKKEYNTKKDEPCNDNTIPLSQESEANDKLFEGLTFILSGFEEFDMMNFTSIIEALSGKIVPKSFLGIPDFGVVPVLGATLKHTVNEIVTDLYIDDCIDQEKMLQIEYFHRPLSIAKNAKPLAGCVVAMSSYTGKERTFLSELIQALGGIYQDTFARKTNVERETYASTHLVCPTPEGQKYNAAVKWKIPAITAEWLKACATEQQLVDETPYLVGETIAPERSAPMEPIPTKLTITQDEKMKPPTSPAIRQILTPKRHLPHSKNQANFGEETPLINKRLSLVFNKTPQSPFHVSTPETPYGQVFKSNPSPDTRKGWVKWVNDLPDLRVEEPPSKRRAPSTPLSELKRQLWEKIKEPLDRRDDDEDGLEEVSQKNNSSEPPTFPENNISKDAATSGTISINKKLNFVDENSPISNNQINLQLAQLDQALQATTNSPETRHSLNIENAKIYQSEPIDPIAKCLIKDSQPDTVGWEDPGQQMISKKSTITEDVEDEYEREVENFTDEELAEEVVPPPKFKFMLSGIKDRNAYEEVIKILGGEVSTEQNFDMSATHLLCIRPSRNEKMLSSIAAGKWVLHCTYLRDCEQQGKFIDEEKYEWGNPKSKGVIPEPTGETEKLIAAAAYKWRIKILQEPGGAFQNMVALLLVQKEKYDQFQRLICAGGGVVVQAKPPYVSSTNGRKITHCFIQLKQMDHQADWAMMASKGILCFLPQYLSEHLTAENPLNPRECVIPEFRKYLALIPK